MRSRWYSATAIAANSANADGWSPMPVTGRAGGASADVRTMSIKPERAHHAVMSKPGLSASSPVSP